MSCAVSPPHPPALRHYGEEFPNVVGSNHILNGDDDRTAAGLDVDGDLGLCPAAQRIEVLKRVIRQP
jgi:hypothetical protein